MDKNNETTKTQTPKVSKELALKELTAFLQKWKPKEFRRGTLTPEKIEEDYIDVLDAIMEGHLMFENLSPVYTLIQPLFGEATDESLRKTKVTFRSRINQLEKLEVMDGLDPEKQRGTYVKRLVQYVTQLSATEIKKLGECKEDFDVVNQIASVF